MFFVSFKNLPCRMSFLHIFRDVACQIEETPMSFFLHSLRVESKR